jgi:hypothetical protein
MIQANFLSVLLGVLGTQEIIIILVIVLLLFGEIEDGINETKSTTTPQP